MRGGARQPASSRTLEPPNSAWTPGAVPSLGPAVGPSLAVLGAAVGRRLTRSPPDRVGGVLVRIVRVGRRGLPGRWCLLGRGKHAMDDPVELRVALRGEVTAVVRITATSAAPSVVRRGFSGCGWHVGREWGWAGDWPAPGVRIDLDLGGWGRRAGNGGT